MHKPKAERYYDWTDVYPWAEEQGLNVDLLREYMKDRIHGQHTLIRIDTAWWDDPKLAPWDDSHKEMHKLCEILGEKLTETYEGVTTSYYKLNLDYWW